MDLTSLALVKTYLEEVSTAFDARLESLITDVSLRVQAVYGVDLEFQEQTEYLDGGGKYLYPRNFPIQSIISIEHVPYWEPELIDPSEYEIVNHQRQVAHYLAFPGGKDGIRMVYESGYQDVSEVPLALQHAVAKQVAFEFQHRKSVGMSEVDVQDGSIRKENTLFLRSITPVLSRLLRRTKIG